MGQKEIFNIITSVFQKSFVTFDVQKIRNEGDWERHLYILFREAFGEKLFNKYVFMVEGRTKKYDGHNLLWISPRIYNKNIELLREFYDLQFDETKELLIDVKKNKKPLNNKIRTFINRQKEKTYKTDFMLLDKKTWKRIFFIELKLGNNLNEKKVQDDFYKLKRSVIIKDPKAIFIAVGYDPINKRVYWKPTDNKFNYSFNLNIQTHNHETKGIITNLQENEILKILKETPQKVYNNFFYANEAFWSCELMYQLNKILPKDWQIHSEITGVFENSRESLDIGIYYQKSLTYAIELKGHWEKGISPELKNNMQNNKKMEDEFFIKVNEFFKKYNKDNKILNSYKEYPKFKGNYFIAPDFLGKIVELYNQCKRMSNLVRNNKIKRGYMVFGDSTDSFKLDKKNAGISKKLFLDNFKYRKYLITKLLKPYLNNCKFIYYYGINSADYTKKDVVIID